LLSGNAAIVSVDQFVLRRPDTASATFRPSATIGGCGTFAKEGLGATGVGGHLLPDQPAPLLGSSGRLIAKATSQVFAVFNFIIANSTIVFNKTFKLIP
jgi:hypothetical protein